METPLCFFHSRHCSMTSALHQRGSCKNKASVTLFGYFTEHDSFEKVVNHSALHPGPKKLVSAPKISVLLRSSVSLCSFIVSSLVPRYPKNDLQQIPKVVLEARTPTVAALLSERPQKRSLKTKFLDVYRGKIHLECYNFC